MNEQNVNHEHSHGRHHDHEYRSDDAWWTERSIGQKILIGIGFGILGIGALFLFGWVVMLLWNWLMPEIFGLPSIDYWQSWGLLLLSSILFKNIGGSGSGGKSDRRRKKKMKSFLEREMEAEQKNCASAAQDPAAPKDPTSGV